MLHQYSYEVDIKNILSWSTNHNLLIFEGITLKLENFGPTFSLQQMTENSFSA